jgi:hypothetical protein
MEPLGPMDSNRDCGRSPGVCQWVALQQTIYFKYLVQRLTLPTIFRVTSAMTTPIFNVIGKLIGRNYSSKFIGQSEIISLGKELNAILTDDQPSDIAQVNRCAVK